MIRLKPTQGAVFRCATRFRILVAGRRFGKTFLALVELCRAAWGPGRLAWYVAPSYKQAKRIAWKPLKEITRPYWASRPNETDLRIELISGGTICLRGADNYDSLRGDGLDFLVLDEFASIAHEAWTEVLRPSLADKEGRACLSAHPRAATISTTFTKMCKLRISGKHSSSPPNKVATFRVKSSKALLTSSTSALTVKNSRPASRTSRPDSSITHLIAP